MSVEMNNRSMRFRLNTINYDLRCLRSRRRRCSRKHFSMIQNFETGIDLQASVIDKQAMKVYIQLDRFDQPTKTKLLVLDLSGDRVEEIVLQKPVAPKNARQFLAIHQNEIVYTEQPFMRRREHETSIP